jgi:hypothetical protein
MDASLYGFISAFTVLLIVCEFAGSIWDFFWEYLK